MLSPCETLAAELTGTGVHVTVLCPTFVKTNILTSDRITALRRAATADALTGCRPSGSPGLLDTHDRGGLYVMPQLEAKVGWQIKESTPRLHPCSGPA